MYDKIIHLKCYTRLAAEAILSALETTDNVFPLPIRLNTSRQLYPVNCFIHIDETGEFYLSTPDDYDFTIDDVIVIMKSFYNVKKIGYRLVETDDRRKILLEEAKQKMFVLSSIIKNLEGKKLTKKALKIIGRPLNPFEQIRFKEILDEYSKCRIYDEESANVRLKIKNYIEKIQGC